MAETPLGSRLDTLGVTADLKPDDLISSAVVVFTVLIDGHERPRLFIANSDGIDWIQQAGMLRLAELVCSEPPEMEEG